MHLDKNFKEESCILHSNKYESILKLMYTLNVLITYIPWQAMLWKKVGNLILKEKE